MWTVEPEPPFLAGARVVEKGAAPAPAQAPALTYFNILRTEVLEEPLCE